MVKRYFRAAEKNNCPKIARDFCSDSRRSNRRILEYATIAVTQKLSKKTSKVGQLLFSAALVLALLWMALPAFTYAATFTASVDRNELAEDEHLVLTLTLANSDTRLRAQGVSPNVDLSVLTADFDIGTPRDNNRFNIFRGRARSTSELIIELFPKRTGNVIIPSFEVDNVATDTITVAVKPSVHGETPLAFAQSGISKPAIWQREQLLVYHDVYYRVELESAKLGEEIETEPTPLELYEHFRLTRTERQEQHNGFTYSVARTSWTIFPTDSGTLTVYFPDTWIVTNTGERIRLPHQQQTVMVNALPADVTADIMVGVPELKLTTLVENATVNQLNSWRVTLRAPVLSTTVPARLTIESLPQVQTYLDRGQLDKEESPDGVIFTSDYTVSAVPLTAGVFQLPAITFPYFDPHRGELKTATLNGPRLAAQAGNRVAATTSLPNNASAALYNEANGPQNNLWQVATFAFAFLWLITLMLSWKRREAKDVGAGRSAVSELEPGPSRGAMQTMLLDAFNSRSLEEGLMDWERVNGPLEDIRNTVRSVQRFYYGQAKDIDAEALKRDVIKAVEKIRKSAINHKQQENRWSPRAFTPVEKRAGDKAVSQ